MAALNPPIYLQAGEYSARDDRLQVASSFDRKLTNEGVYTLDRGVFPPQDQLEVYSPGGVGGTINVRPGLSCVPQDSYDPPGMYLMYNRGVETITLNAPGLRPRIDIIVCELLDLEQGGKDPVTQETNRWRFRVLKGTEDDNPRPPAASVTLNMVELAHVTVRPLSATGGEFKVTNADIVDRRQFISSLGGVHLYWSRLPDNSPGRLAYNVPAKRLEISDGTRFLPVMTEASMARYMEAYRPRQAYSRDRFYLAADSQAWVQLPIRHATNTAITTPISISNIQSRSGLFKVSITTKLRSSGAEVRASLSASVRESVSKTTIVGPAWVRAVETSSQLWSTVSHTSIYGGLPVDTPLDFTLEFRLTDSKVPATTSPRVDFHSIFLVVEPVI